MKYLSIDVGEKRIGLAISDDSGSLAFPLKVIDAENCVPNIIKEAKDRNVKNIVVGDSKNLKGEDNPIMRFINKIVSELKDAGFVVELEPELFSSVEAERLGKGIDSEAAAIILQSYLDRNK